MALGYRLRDAHTPRGPILAEAGIRKGDTVLDFGCGPGSYVTEAARAAGADGKVYALDVHPLAVRMAAERARKAGLTNVSTILSGLSTGLADRSVDVVLLYDVYHGLEEPKAVLEELCRVLTPGGTLSVHDHHLDRAALVGAIEGSGLFHDVERGRHTERFAPVKG